MARLTIVQKRGKFSLTIPHKVLVNGQLLGVMKDKQVVIEMPEGGYEVTIQSMFPFISASERVQVADEHETTLTFCDREQWWDALFVVFIAALFFISYRLIISSAQNDKWI